MSEKLSVYRLREGLSDHVRIEEGELSIGYFTVVFGYEYKSVFNIPMLCICYVSNGGRIYRVEQKTCLSWYEKMMNTEIDADNEAEVRKLSEDKEEHFAARPDTIHFDPKDDELIRFIDNPKFYTPYWVTPLLERWQKEHSMPKDEAEKQINGEDDTTLFNTILREMSATHTAKNADYGNSFTSLFEECGMTYAYGHLKEKLERIKTLMKSRQQVKQESLLDSLYDLANYAVMTIVELKKKHEGERVD